jgi:hypothetical protein
MRELQQQSGDSVMGEEGQKVNEGGVVGSVGHIEK